MPKAAALSCVSTMAYSGSLLGPALVGLTSEIMGLSLVFRDDCSFINADYLF